MNPINLELSVEQNDFPSRNIAPYNSHSATIDLPKCRHNFFVVKVRATPDNEENPSVSEEYLQIELLTEYQPAITPQDLRDYQTAIKEIIAHSLEGIRNLPDISEHERLYLISKFKEELISQCDNVFK